MSTAYLVAALVLPWLGAYAALGYGAVAAACFTWLSLQVTWAASSANPSKS